MFFLGGGTSIANVSALEQDSGVIEVFDSTVALDEDKIANEKIAKSPRRICWFCNPFDDEEYDNYERNNSKSDANNIGDLDESFEMNNANIHSSDDVDWYKFNTVKYDGQVEFQLNNIPSGNDYDIYVYNGSTLIGTGTKASNVSENFKVNVKKGDNIYVKIYSHSGKSNSNYTFIAKNSTIKDEYTYKKDNVDTISWNIDESRSDLSNNCEVIYTTTECRRSYIKSKNYLSEKALVLIVDATNLELENPLTNTDSFVNDNEFIEFLDEYTNISYSEYLQLDDQIKNGIALVYNITIGVATSVATTNFCVGVISAIVSGLTDIGEGLASIFNPYHQNIVTNMTFDYDELFYEVEGKLYVHDIDFLEIVESDFEYVHSYNGYTSVYIQSRILFLD